MADDRVERLRDFYAGLAKGDLSAAETLFDFDDMLMREPAGLPYGGDYRGRTGFLKGIEGINAAWKRVRFADFSFSVGENLVIVHFTMTAVSRSTGREMSTPVCEVWRFRGGKVYEVAPFYWDTHAMRDVLGLG